MLRPSAIREKKEGGEKKKKKQFMPKRNLLGRFKRTQKRKLFI